MEEALVRALVIGSTFAVLGLTATFVRKLLRSPSETARRGRQVLALGIAGLLLLGLITGSDSDRGLVLGIAAIIGAGWWIFRGSRKS